MAKKQWSHTTSLSKTDSLYDYLISCVTIAN